MTPPETESTQDGERSSAREVSVSPVSVPPKSKTKAGVAPGRGKSTRARKRGSRFDGAVENVATRRASSKQQEPTSTGTRVSGFEKLLRNLGEFVLVMDSSGRIEGLWSLRHGLSDPPDLPLVGRRLHEVVDAKCHAQLDECLERAARGERLEAEYWVELADGPHLFVIWITPKASAMGRSSCCVFARDVTQRKVTHEALAKNEALLRKAEEIGKMGAWEINIETGDGIWSDQLHKLFGMDPREGGMSGQLLLALAHPDDREKLVRMPGFVPYEGEYPEHEARFILPDGRVRTFRTRGMPIRDASGRVTHLAGLSEDITERKEVQERLQRSETLLAQAEQLANMGSWELFIDSSILRWSAHYHRMLGLEPSPDPVPYGTGIKMIHPDDVERATRDLNHLRATGKPLDNVLRFITAKGELRIFHSRGVMVRDDKGRPFCIRGMSQDITEQKIEEDRVLRSEALLTNAEQIANLGSWECSYKTGKVTLSRSLLQIYGLESSEEWNIDSHWKRLHPEDRTRVQRIVNRAKGACMPFSYVVRYIRPNGGMRVHSVWGVPIAGPDGKAEGSVGVVQDITDQTRATEDLRRLSREVMRARDEERRQAARELHESAGQSLAALKMTLGQLRQALVKTNKRAAKLLHSCMELANTTAKEVRTVSYLMHPPLLDEAGIGPAVQWYARGFDERSGIETRVETTRNLGRQSKDVEMTAFRIVQEALTNVYRYSGSASAVIRLMRRNRELVVEVRDEGRGFALPMAENRRTTLGVGIAGMRERVEQLNGLFELESAPGRGTTVRAILPLVRGRKKFTKTEKTEGTNAEKRRKPRHVAIRRERRSHRAGA